MRMIGSAGSYSNSLRDEDVQTMSPNCFPSLLPFPPLKQVQNPAAGTTWVDRTEVASFLTDLRL